VPASKAGLFATVPNRQPRRLKSSLIELASYPFCWESSPTQSLFLEKAAETRLLENPSLRIKEALKKRNAAYFLKVGIRFEPIGKVSSNNQRKISIGVIGGKTKSNQQRLRMLTEFVLHDSTGAVVKKLRPVLTPKK
jgi:hypothetical protein